MSYYGEKKAEDILKETVERELSEFSGGAAVSSPKMAGFIARRLANSLVPLGVGALFGLVLHLVVPFVIIAAILELFSLVQFFSGDRLVNLICEAAKKAPDKKISTIIAENCLRDESHPLPLRETKPRKVGAKPFIITFCALFGAFVLGVVAFFCLPITLYSNTEGGCAVSLCRAGLSSSVTIEPYKNGKPVVGINSGAFKNNFFLKEVSLPDFLTYIEGEAFMNCVALESIEIPPRVTEIRGDTFSDCKRLQDVRLHDNITALHAGCFKGCESLREITLPHGITEIRANTFDSCYSLMRIDIPEGVTRIAARAFYDCDSLYDVYVPRTVEEIRSSAFRSCERLDRIALPEGCIVDERAFKESPTEILYY